MRACFYDTWAYVALCNAADPDHDAAAQADLALAGAGYVRVTSDYVFDEALTGLHAAAGARVALEFADLVEAWTEGGELVRLGIDRARHDRALALFRRLAPEVPRLSFTDCTSLELMREQSIPVAFTADRHFHRAGTSIRPLFERRGQRLVARLPVDAPPRRH